MQVPEPRGPFSASSHYIGRMSDVQIVKNDTQGAGHSSPRILVVRPSALGDVARTVPVLVSLKKAFPDARIDWLVSEVLADVIAHHPLLNEAIGFPRDRFGGMFYNPAIAYEVWQFARSLRNRKYDIVIDLQGLVRSGIFTWMTRAPRRIGFSNAREGAWFAYNEKYHIDSGQHTVDRMLGLLEAAGIEPVRDMNLHTSDEDHKWLEHFLASQPNTDKRYALIAPTAKWLCKCWPADRYGQIIHRFLQHRTDISYIIVMSSPSENNWIEPIRRRFSNDPRVLFPNTTVGQACALISRAKIVVCNDSAALHIAVGFDRRVVTIFGPTNPELVGPYEREDVVIQPEGITPEEMADYRGQKDDQSLIARVTADKVWETVTKQLDQK